MSRSLLLYKCKCKCKKLNQINSKLYMAHPCELVSLVHARVQSKRILGRIFKIMDKFQFVYIWCC